MNPTYDLGDVILKESCEAFVELGVRPPVQSHQIDPLMTNFVCHHTHHRAPEKRHVHVY